LEKLDEGRRRKCFAVDELKIDFLSKYIVAAL